MFGLSRTHLYLKAYFFRSNQKWSANHCAESALWRISCFNEMYNYKLNPMSFSFLHNCENQIFSWGRNNGVVFTKKVVSSRKRLLHASSFAQRLSKVFLFFFYHSGKTHRTISIFTGFVCPQISVDKTDSAKLRTWSPVSFHLTTKCKKLQNWLEKGTSLAKTVKPFSRKLQE